MNERVRTEYQTALGFRCRFLALHVLDQKLLVRTEVAEAVAQVKPDSIVHNDAADFFSGGDELEKNRNDALDLARREMFEEIRTHGVDAGELPFAMLASAELIADVNDAARFPIERDVKSGAAAAENEGDDVLPFRVFFQQRREREVAEDVAIIDDEVFVRHEVGDVRDAPCGFEQLGFVAEGQRHIFVSAIGKCLGKLFRQMMRVDDELAHAVFQKMIEGMFDERLVEDRDERLRKLVGERSQSRAEAGAQNKCLVHPRDLRSYDDACKRNGAGDDAFLRSMDRHERSIIAAQGYLELGMFRQVWRELNTLPAVLLGEPIVLEILTLTRMGERRWLEALEMARRLRASRPEEPGGFIHEAYCLHELGRTSEALDVLGEGPPALRETSVFYYNAGCYRARLGDIDGAMELLRKSFEMDADLRKSAKRDPDLTALKDKL